MAVGSTFSFNVTRNELVEMAYHEANLLDIRQSIDAIRLSKGIRRLNVILKRLDAEKKYIHAITPVPSTLTLAANTFKYDSSNGLPTNIKRLAKVMYRNAAGDDTPVDIIRTEDFAAISDKFTRGDPTDCFLTEHRDVGSQTMYVWPALSSVNTADVVLGTDALDYTCIRSHEAADVNKPITGADYLLYWEQTGSGGSAWASGTDYVAAQHLRLWHERPLFDFVEATDNPDLPQEWIEPLLYELTQAFHNVAGTDINEKDYMRRLKEESKKAIQPSQYPMTTNKHNKTKYF